MGFIYEFAATLYSTYVDVVVGDCFKSKFVVGEANYH